jgi:misacylated tRNA(Ala) deacylase
MDVPDREQIRVVEVEGVDRQACGGTHVRNTGEIRGIRLVKAENKGKSNRRVYFELAE